MSKYLNDSDKIKFIVELYEIKHNDDLTQDEKFTMLIDTLEEISKTIDAAYQKLKHRTHGNRYIQTGSHVKVKGDPDVGIPSYSGVVKSQTEKHVVIISDYYLELSEESKDQVITDEELEDATPRRL